MFRETIICLVESVRKVNIYMYTSNNILKTHATYCVNVIHREETKQKYSISELIFITSALLCHHIVFTAYYSPQSKEQLLTC